MSLFINAIYDTEGGMTIDTYDNLERAYEALRHEIQGWYEDIFDIPTLDELEEMPRKNWESWVSGGGASIVKSNDDCIEGEFSYDCILTHFLIKKEDE